MSETRRRSGSFKLEVFLSDERRRVQRAVPSTTFPLRVGGMRASYPTFVLSGVIFVLLVLPCFAAGQSSPHFPTQVAGYRLVTLDSQATAGDGQSAFVYRNESGVRILVFSEQLRSDSALMQDRVLRQAEAQFEAKLAKDVSLGLIESEHVAFADKWELPLTRGREAGIKSIAAVRQHGEVRICFFFAFIDQDSLVTIQAAIPESGWRRTDVPLFAQDLANAHSSGS